MTRWLYLEAGQVTHAVARSGDVGARCGTRPYGYDFWWGDGCEFEEENARALPRCQRCVMYLEKDFYVPRGVRR